MLSLVLGKKGSVFETSCIDSTFKILCELTSVLAAYKRTKPCSTPVLFRYVHCQHLQGLHALNHPAMPLINPGRFHFEETVGHAAPQHGIYGLDIQSGRTLWNRVLMLTLEDG